MWFKKIGRYWTRYEIVNTNGWAMCQSTGVASPQNVYRQQTHT